MGSLPIDDIQVIPSKYSIILAWKWKQRQNKNKDAPEINIWVKASKPSSESWTLYTKAPLSQNSGQTILQVDGLQPGKEYLLKITASQNDAMLVLEAKT